MRDTLKKKKRTNRGRGKEKKREKKREKRRVGRYGFDYHVQRVSNRSM